MGGGRIIARNGDIRSEKCSPATSRETKVWQCRSSLSFESKVRPEVVTLWKRGFRSATLRLFRLQCVVAANLTSILLHQWLACPLDVKPHDARLQPQKLRKSTATACGKLIEDAVERSLHLASAIISTLLAMLPGLMSSQITCIFNPHRSYHEYSSQGHLRTCVSAAAGTELLRMMIAAR